MKHEELPVIRWLACRKVGLMSAEDRMITETDSRPSAVSNRALSGDSLGCPSISNELLCERVHQN